MLQRVYYETSALLPALAFTISKNNGSVTEYLGDGVLAFFKVDEENVTKSIYEAIDAAKECLDYCLETINTVLKNRYGLPKLEIGIGLAYGEALVTLVGIERDLLRTMWKQLMTKFTIMKYALLFTIVACAFTSMAQTKTIDKDKVCEPSDVPVYMTIKHVDEFKDSLTFSLDLRTVSDGKDVSDKRIVFSEKMKNESSIVKISMSPTPKIS